jgi:hypothetical protein
MGIEPRRGIRPTGPVPSLMVTAFSLLVRNPALTQAAFREHWRETHAPLVRRLTYLQGYVQNARSNTPPPRLLTASRLDGVAGFWWSDRRDAIAATTDPVYVEGAQRDEPRFLEITKLHAVQTTPQQLHGPTAHPAPEITAVKAIAFIHGRDDADHAVFASEFAQHWSYAVRHIPHPADRSILHSLAPRSGIPREPDAVIEFWWSSMDRYERWADCCARRLAAHPAVDPARSSILMVEESIVITPPATFPV